MDDTTFPSDSRAATRLFLDAFPQCLPDPGATDPWKLGKPARLPGTQRGGGTGAPLPISSHGHAFFKFLDPETGMLVEDVHLRTAWAMMPKTAESIEARTGWIARRV